MGRRHHLCQAGRRLRLPRRRHRRFLAQGRRLCDRCSSGGPSGARGARHGDRGARSAARPHPSFRSRRAIRLQTNTPRSSTSRGFQRCMSRPGNPYDNAKAESFMKTLKAEEVNGRAYVNLEDARANIDHLHRRHLQRRPPPLRPRLQIADCLRSRMERSYRSQTRQTLPRLVTKLACLTLAEHSTSLTP